MLGETDEDADSLGEEERDEEIDLDTDELGDIEDDGEDEIEELRELTVTYT